MGRDEEDSSKTVERNSLDLSRPSVLEILEINLQHGLDVIDVPEAVSNRRRVVALDSGPSGNWESCSARRSFLTFGIFGWTWYHSSGLVKPCFVVVRFIFFFSRIYLKRKEEGADLIFLLTADVASLGPKAKRQRFWTVMRGQHLADSERIWRKGSCEAKEIASGLCSKLLQASLTQNADKICCQSFGVYGLLWAQESSQPWLSAMHKVPKTDSRFKDTFINQ